jgi:hypothetical protein
MRESYGFPSDKFRLGTHGRLTGISSEPRPLALVNLEYVQRIDDNRGVYLEFAYGW